MFTKFKLLVGLVAVTLVSAVTIGLSTFYFGSAAEDERDIHNTVGETGEEEIKADNILENYDFGQEDLNESYTYIFFPSTLYNEFSADEIEKPENVFGYNEVVLDDFGDPVTKNGEVQYEVVTKDSTGVTFINDEFTAGNTSTDNFYTNYYDLLKNSLNDNSEYYLYDLSSGDYPQSSERYSDAKDSYWIGEADRYFPILNINDPYSLNNYHAFTFFNAYTSFKNASSTNFDGDSVLEDIWVNSGRDYADRFEINKKWGHFYNNVDPKEEEPIDYSKRPLSFSKEQEILSPLVENYKQTSTYDNQTVNYNFGLDLTDDYEERKNYGEISTYISNFRGNEGLSASDNHNPGY